MKKVLAALLIISVVCAAGAALAMPGHREFSGRRHNSPEFAPGDFMPPPPPPDMNNMHKMHRHGHRHMRFAPDMTPEIRAKVVELEKFKIDLEEALTSKPVNKAKALEVHAKMQTLKNDLDNWRFERKLERIEKFRKFQESKPMPKPESEPESESEPKE